jgi:hypothetical protein
MSARPHANDARSLFAAAREDGPAAHERDAVFRRVALTTGIAAGTAAVAAVATAAAPAGTSMAAAASVAGTAAGAGAGATASASAFSMKLLGVGALMGAVGTALGLLLTVTLVMPEALPAGRGGGSTTRNAGATSAEVVDARGTSSRTREVSSGAKLAAPNARARDTADATAKAKALADAKAVASAQPEVTPRADAPSDLAEEARLVTAARTALVAGDAAHALVLVQATRKLGARALEPEELGLEARALRALGRADDAAATELVLRRRYPESALAR